MHCTVCYKAIPFQSKWLLFFTQRAATCPFCSTAKAAQQRVLTFLRFVHLTTMTAAPFIVISEVFFCKLATQPTLAKGVIPFMLTFPQSQNRQLRQLLLLHLPSHLLQTLPVVFYQAAILTTKVLEKRIISGEV